MSFRTVAAWPALVLLLTLGLIGQVLAQPRQGSSDVSYQADITFTLETGIADGKMVFIGRAGSILGVVNPQLNIPENSVVQINLVNGDGAVHDIAVPDLGIKSDNITGQGSSTSIVFRVGESGIIKYICSLPGHEAAGMVGELVVGEQAPLAESDVPLLSQDPNAVGDPVGAREPLHLTVDLETTEVIGQLADGSTYGFWTFNDQVPGPLIRARVNDTITINMANAANSAHIHSIDLHAVNGPGGGAAVTQAAPGQTKSFSFKALRPGLYVYHCATPMVAQHITNGMYGLILIEPEGGLAAVDKEFYVMQGELYTSSPHGTLGHQHFSMDNMLNEQAQHFLFNGHTNALTQVHRMEAEVGDTVRIYFGVGGPNASASFHVIGEIFDRVYQEGSLSNPPLLDVSTIIVPAGGASLVEFQLDYPGRYTLVDHALSRAEKGLVGFLHVTGPEDPEVFQSLESSSAAP